MGEMKDIGKLTERARNATRGIRRTETTRVQASLLLRMADIIEPLADLLEKHDVDMDGLKALAEAGAMLPVTRDGVRFILGTFDRPLHWIDYGGDVKATYEPPYYDDDRGEWLSSDAMDRRVSEMFADKEAALKALKQEKGE